MRPPRAHAVNRTHVRAYVDIPQYSVVSLDHWQMYGKVDSPHAGTAQTCVYMSMVQISGWACTSLQVTPWQEIGSERGRAFAPGRSNIPNFMVIALCKIICPRSILAESALGTFACQIKDTDMESIRSACCTPLEV